jgi:hypothetical protein
MPRRETTLAAAWSVLLTAIVLGPTLYAALVGAPGMHFTGSLEFFFYDTNTYIAWIQQGREGWFYFMDRYTTEPTSRCFFHPVFLALGWLVRVTGLPIVGVWVAARVLTAIGAVFCIYLFARRALGERRQAVVALVLITLGGGLGWINRVAGEDIVDATDIWMPELTVYQSLRWPILWTLALMLMTAYFANVVEALTSGSRRATILAGLAFAAIAFVHPYHVVTFAVVPAVFLAMRLVRGPTFEWRLVRNYVVIGLMAAPPALYQMVVARVDPVLYLHLQNATLSPPPTAYLAGFGPVLLALAALGLRGAWRESDLTRFAVVWLVVGALLLYFPVPFNRRLVTGLMIPVGLLASYPIEAAISRALGARPTRARAAAAACALALVVIAIVPTNLYASRDDWGRALNPSFPFFVSDDMARALEWLRTAPQGVVVADGPTSNLVPAFSGQTVYAGHWAQTIDYGTKLGEVRALLSGKQAPRASRRFLATRGARYVLYGPRERELSEGAFDPSALGPVRFRSGDVEIVEVEGATRAGVERPAAS